MPTDPIVSQKPLSEMTPYELAALLPVCTRCQRHGVCYNGLCTFCEPLCPACRAPGYDVEHAVCDTCEAAWDAWVGEQQVAAQ